jgi:sec-independent protein translocase protein TatA
MTRPDRRCRRDVGLVLYTSEAQAYCHDQKHNVMNTLFAGFFGGWEIVLILAVVLILFGAKKLPELAKGLGQGIKEFKKATNEVSNEINSAMDDNRYTSAPPRDRQIESNVQSKPADSAHPDSASKA